MQKFFGEIVGGDALARKLGFATLNFAIEKFPQNLSGVFAARVKLENEIHDAVVFVGKSKTFEIQKMKIEAHILNFENFETRAKRGKIEFVAKIRDAEKFTSAENLKLQIARDVNSAAEILNRDFPDFIF